MQLPSERKGNICLRLILPSDCQCVALNQVVPIKLLHIRNDCIVAPYRAAREAFSVGIKVKFNQLRIDVVSDVEPGASSEDADHLISTHRSRRKFHPGCSIRLRKHPFASVCEQRDLSPPWIAGKYWHAAEFLQVGI